MEANTVVLDLKRYHQLIEKEKIVDTKQVYKHTVLVFDDCYSSITLKTNDDAVAKIAEDLKLANKEKAAAKEALKNSLRANNELKEDHEHKLNELAHMSIWEFKKWRKTI